MILAVLAVLALLAAGGAAFWATHRAGAPAVEVSGTGSGTPGALLSADAGAAAGTPAAQRTPAWTSTAPAVGAWLELTWSAPTRVDRVRALSAAAGGASVGPRSLLLEFDGGPAELVTSTAGGGVDATFPARTVTTVRLTVASTDGDRQDAAAAADVVALAALAVDDTGDGPVTGATPLSAADLVTATASSEGPADAASGGSATTAGALLDGDVATGDPGAAWRAAADDARPWVQLEWAAPRSVASVQVVGPATADLPGQPPFTPPLSGRLVFDDGSAVAVSGVVGGAEQPTLVAFAPRVTTSVRLELTPGTAGAPVELRELRAYGTGTSPARWPAPQAAASPAPETSTCDPSAPGAPVSSDSVDTAHPVVLVCPATGSAVGADATVVVAAAPGTAVQALAAPVGIDGSQPTVRPVAQATAGADGRAALTFRTDDLPASAFGVLVQRTEDTGTQEGVRLTLVNPGGVPTTSSSTAPKGMTLQWEDDFSGPLSVSADGDGAVYAARKPTLQGGASFGDEGFADPAQDPTAVGSVEGSLRLRAQEGRSAALLSSLRVGGGGFAAQYGYFEARILGGPGPGSWPAFWALDSTSATGDATTSGEVDAVELYGHAPLASCHSVHVYDPSLEGGKKSTIDCIDENGEPDWGLTWHTYGVRVLPDRAVFSIDGKEVADARGLGRSEDPFYFMLDQALGGGWPVDLSATGGVTETHVDWVRVYS